MLIATVTDSGLWPLIIQHVLPVAIPAILGGLGWLIVQGGRWLSERYKHTALGGYYAKVAELAKGAVDHVERGTKAALLEATADGKLTAAERKQLQGEAVRLLKEWLGEHGLKEASKLLGLSGSALESWLVGVVETKVETLSQERKALAVPVAKVSAPAVVPSPS